jgi:hypothetical protein
MAEVQNEVRPREAEIGEVQAEKPRGKVHVVRHSNSIGWSAAGVGSNPV